VARLPVPGSDVSDWGVILNEFLRIAHNEDGSLKLSTSVAQKYTMPKTGIPKAHLATDVQASLTMVDDVISGLSGLEATAQSTQTTLDAKQDVIPAGTITQYYRGDKSWQPLDKTAVGLGNVTNEAQLPLTGGTVTGDVRIGTFTTLSSDAASKRLAIVDSTAPASGNRILIDTYASPAAALPGGLYGWNNQTLSAAGLGQTHSFIAAMKNNAGTNTGFAGTVSQAIGIWLPGDIKGSGTITEYYGIKAGIVPAVGNTVTITNYYGLSIESPGSAAYAIGNHYGIRIKDQVSAGSPNAYALYTGSGRVRFGDDVVMADGKNISTGTGTGLKIGTASSQKLGFYGAAPVPQPAGGSLMAGVTFTANEQLMINRMWSALRGLGLMA
jgi:hypothetical protein